jgi:hypothetical protein
MINGQIDNFTATIYTLQKHNFDFGLNDYTIWNEEYRPILNKAITDYYMFHEIGWHNPNVFRHYLTARMDLIMRNKYNAMYIAKSKDFNPLWTLDVTDEYSHTVENENTGEINFNTNSSNNTVVNSNSTVNTDTTSDASNDALALVSNYPSENMVNNDLTSNVYVNNGQKNTTNTNTTDNSEEKTTSSDNTTATLIGTDKTTNSGNTKTTETYTKHSYGSASDLSFAHAMVQFKDYCDQYRIDEQIISELADLFINVY